MEQDNVESPCLTYTVEGDCSTVEQTILYYVNNIVFNMVYVKKETIILCDVAMYEVMALFSLLLMLPVLLLIMLTVTKLLLWV